MRSVEASSAIGERDPFLLYVGALSSTLAAGSPQLKPSAALLQLYAASLHLLVVFSLFGSLSLGGVGESRPVKIQPI